MTYLEWFENHSKKHSQIIKKLKGRSKEEIIEYFKFENMVKNEPDFCPLYQKNRKCHDLEYLNCYFCGCPYFRFLPNATKGKVSYCSINAKQGTTSKSKGKIHQNCSFCNIPHTKEFVYKMFDLDWENAMKETALSQL